jgi:hypothetical protein
MELIEQIGSYAGLAAIVGLAVLSALYFSQARDVRRLREVHEGRAPSMATPQLRAAQRAAASPAAPAPGEAAAPAGKAAEPQPTGVTRVAPPAPAVPVASASGTQSAEAAKPGAKPSTDSEAAETPAAGEESAETPAPERAPAAAAAGTGAQAATSAGAPPRPAGPAPGGNAQGGRPIPTLARPRRPAAPPGAAAIRLGEASASRRAPWFGRLDPRYTVLIVGAALVLGIAGVVGIYALGDGDEASTDRAVDGTGRASAPLDPSTITVAVLNGTSVAGAADQVANVVESAGYQRGTVDNAAESSAESAVLFAEGAKPAARQVGRELDISQVELIDSDTESLVGSADVAVVVGADRAE